MMPLAWLAPAEIDVLLQDETLDRFTEATLSGADVLRARLSEIRKLGYAVTFGERDPGVVGVAAPIWDENERVAAGLSVVIPSHRVDERRLQEAITAVRAHADQVSDRFRLIRS